MSPIAYVERRKQRQEMERRIKANQGRQMVTRHIRNQKKKVREFWDLAKDAYRVGNVALYRKISAAISATRQDINRWEQRLVYFKVIEAQRDQVLAGAEFANAFHAMAGSMLAHANPSDLVRIQQDAQMAMARADQMDMALENLVEMTDDLLSDVEGERSAELEEIMAAVAREAEQEREPGFDADIEASLKQVEEALNRDLGR